MSANRFGAIRVLGVFTKLDLIFSTKAVNFSGFDEIVVYLLPNRASSAVSKAG
jgi:hypothetical protein